MLRETDVYVQVRVVADSHPFLLGGQDCQDAVEVQLQEPLASRNIFDRHSGRSVSVIGAVPYNVADAQPPVGLEGGDGSDGAEPDEILPAFASRVEI